MKAIKKLLFTIFFLIQFSNGYAQIDNSIIGEWVIVKLETDSTTIIADSAAYFLYISENEFKFNLGMNYCSAEDSLEIKEGKIKYNSLKCTEIGGDEGYGNLYGKINYNGLYKLEDSNSMLLIKNELGMFYLRSID